MTLHERLGALLSAEKDATATLSNAAAFLFDEFDDLNWCGFYLFSRTENCLILGPFQGKPACVKISSGKGVCGAALIQGETIIVEDVNNFPEHIACDAESNSEIVVPLFINGNIWGVLDLDSNALNAFSKSDKKYLENMCNFLAETLNFNESLI